MNLDKPKYSILYLDDDATKDKRITEFQKLAREEGIDVRIVNDTDLFLKMCRRIGQNTKTWDLIICDIEIWQESEDGIELLTGLGFSYIEKLTKEGHNYIYIILTKATRDFYDRIMSSIRSIQRVKQKDKVFKSKDSIRDFIEELKQYIDNKRQSEIKKTPKTSVIFDLYNNFIHQQTNYPLTITLRGHSTQCFNYNDLEYIITEQLTWLISEWTKIQNDFSEGKRNYQMIKIVAFQLGYGGELRKHKGNIERKKIDDFVKKLILRRFTFYISSKCSISLKQACSTISDKNRCFDNILLFSTTGIHTKEEIAYKETL